jgi:hypothetical protein
MVVGPYVRGLEWVFDHGQWGGGYGGKPWGQIAKTLGDFLYGKTSLEMMCDTAYTLAHNNGPMFNKGMMYDMYSSKQGFLMILDVQASGQIPQLIVDRAKYHYIKSFDMPALVAFTELARKHMPDEFHIEVDWQKVEDGQAHKPANQQHKYADYKAKMLNKGVTVDVPDDALSSMFDTVGKVSPPKALVISATMFGGKKMNKTGGVFKVAPGQAVHIYERAE